MLNRDVEIRHAVMPVILKYGVIDVERVVRDVLTTAQDLSSGIVRSSTTRAPAKRTKSRKPKQKLTRMELYQKNKEVLLSLLAKAPDGLKTEDIDAKKYGMSKHQVGHGFRALVKEKLIEGKGHGRHRKYVLKKNKTTNGVAHEARA